MNSFDPTTMSNDGLTRDLTGRKKISTPKNGGIVTMKRPRARLRNSKGGEMGVGTLIVFISMVLVTTVASSVVISTAFKIQQQAEDTGKATMAEVGTGLKVMNIAASRENPNDAWVGNTNMFEILKIKVALLSGGNQINVSDLIIQIGDRDTDNSLSFVDVGPGENYLTQADGEHFTVEPMRDMAPANDTLIWSMMTPGDVALLYINCNASGMRLTTQTSCFIKFIPRVGIPTTESFVTPSVYGGTLITPVT